MQQILSKRLISLMKVKGFTSLTDIQKISMPKVGFGKNVLIIAPTGWGKTEAALLPLLSKIEGKGVKILYITPLRALNRDMVERTEWWCSQIGITVSVRHGDTKRSERSRQAKTPPQVMVTTPETLQALLPSKVMGKALENVEHVIIDEVHELFSDKRGAQLAIALERLLQKRGKEFQRIGLSATVGDPGKVAKYLFGNRAHEIVNTENKREMNVKIECPRSLEKYSEMAERLSLDKGSVARLVRLHELCMEHKATLLFVNTRKVGEILASRMRMLEKELGEKVGKIAVHHGSLSRDERIEMEKQFKSGKLKGLIATSSLELGMDIGDVDLVVQYMSPRQVSRIIQRVGRSGHAIGKKPKGVVVASDSDDILEAVAIREGMLDGEIERNDMQNSALDVMAHQLVGLVMDWNSIHIEKAFEVIRRAGPYLKISLDEVYSVANQLKPQRCLWLGEEKILSKSSNTFEYYFGNLSMIPKQKKIPVRNAATNRLISNLDEIFASTLERGSAFITKGVPWRVLDINEEEVVVEPSGSFESAVPDWIGEEIPVPFWVAQKVGELRTRVVKGEELEGTDSECLKKVNRKLSQQMQLPHEKLVYIESCENTVVIHTCLGSKGNEAFGRVLAELLTSSLGSSVRAEIDPYRVALLLPVPVRASKVEKIIRELGNARGVLENSIARSSLFMYKFLHVGRAFGAFTEDARIGPRFVKYMIKTPIYQETMREMFENYLDVEVCNKLLLGIRNGRINIISKDVPELSPLGKAAVVRISTSELISPLEPTSEVLKAFKKGLLKKNVRMVCTYCGKLAYKKLESFGKKVKCEHCGSSLIALSNEREEKALKKAKAKRTKEERKAVIELMRKASLMDAYGRRGAIALSVYGVGAETASRVLQKIHQNEDLLLIDLLEAQKKFIKTKRYWSV